MIERNLASILAARVASVLSQIETLKKEQRYEEAIHEINESLRTDLGLSARFVKGLTGQDLLGMLRSGLISVDRLVVLAKLIKERADINWAQSQPDNGLIRTLKALTLYLEAFGGGQKSAFAGYFSDIEGLADNLGDYQLPPDLRMKLFRYYEQAAKYSKAEDVLFEGLEASAGSGWIEEGRKFYERLAGKSDEELASGNLPREELEESRAELARFDSHD